MKNQRNSFAMIELKKTSRVRFLELKFISSFRGFEIGFETLWLCRSRWRRRRCHITVRWIHHHRTIITIHTTKTTLSHFARVSKLLKNRFRLRFFSLCRSNQKAKKKRLKLNYTIYVFDVLVYDNKIELWETVPKSTKLTVTIEIGNRFRGVYLYRHYGFVLVI